MPLRLLILSSLPDSSAVYSFDSLRTDRKARGLLQAIAASPYHDVVEPTYIGAVPVSELARTLSEHRPDILHLIVHGASDILAFEDWAGDLVTLAAEQLARIVADTASIRLVCLEVCHSRGIAEALARTGRPGLRPFAVGMHFELPSGTGDRFFARLYQGLFATGRIDLGFADARRALELDDNRGHVLPALICPEGQAADTRLFTPWPLRSAPPTAMPKEVELRGPYAELPALFVGREDALRRLGECWADPAIGVVQLHGPAGSGKTSLVREWLRRVRGDGWRNATRVWTWSLASDGDVRQFFAALEPSSEPPVRQRSCSERDGLRLAGRLRSERVLLVLDDVAALPRGSDEPRGSLARALHPALAGLLRGLADGSPGLCVIVTRTPPGDAMPGVAPLSLDRLPPAAACEVLWQRGLIADPMTLAAVAGELDGLAGALALATGPRYADDARIAEMRRRLQEGAAATPLARAWRSLPPLSTAARAVLRTIAERGGEVRPVPDMASAIRELARAGLLSVDLELRGHVAQPAIVELALDEIRPAATSPSATKFPAAETFEALRAVIDEVRQTARRGASSLAARRYIDEVCCYEPAKYQWSKIARTFQAVAEDLELLSLFFAAPWTTLLPALVDGPDALSLHDQGYLLHRAALALRHLGRIGEAQPPMQQAGAVFTNAGYVDRAVTCANDLAELLMRLDHDDDAMVAISRAITLATPSDDPRELHLLYATRGHLLDRARRWEEAADAFATATRYVVRLNAATGLHTARSVHLAALPGLYHFEHRLAAIARLAAEDQDTSAAVAMLAEHLVAAYTFHLHPNIAPHSQAFVMLGWGRLAALCAENARLVFPAAEAWEVVPDPSALARAIAAGSEDPAARALGVYAELFLSRAVTILRDTHNTWMLPMALLPRATVRTELLGDRVNARLDLEEALEIAGDDMPRVKREAQAIRTRLSL